jgi:hypothetical protein
MNKDYFENIDEPRKAYWLGFLSADGCLKNNKVALCLADRNHIEKFKKDLQSEHAITTSNVLDKRTNKIYTSYSIQITNKDFTQKLTKYIPVNKSENFSMPQIDNKLIPYFLAGMFDGDGSFTLKSKTNYLTANLISTKECLIQIQDYLFLELGIEKTKLLRVTKDSQNVWKLGINSGAMKVLEHIYCDEDKTIYLTRKVEKLNKIKKHLKENPNNKGCKRRPVFVYKNNEKIKTFKSTKECVDFYGMSTSTLFDRLKTGKPFKEMTFIGQEIIKY